MIFEIWTKPEAHFYINLNSFKHFILKVLSYLCLAPKCMSSHGRSEGNILEICLSNFKMDLAYFLPRKSRPQVLRLNLLRLPNSSAVNHPLSDRWSGAVRCAVTVILHTLLIGRTVAILHVSVVAPLARGVGYNLCVNKGALTESTLCHEFAFPALPFLLGCRRG